MIRRRPQNHSYRSRPRRTGRTLPDYLDGTKRTTPIKRPDPHYPTIPLDNDKKGA